MDDPVGASVIWCAMGDYLGVDLRLLIGWRNSPGFSGLMASALKHSHTLSTFKFAAISPQGAAAGEHVRLTPARSGSVTSLPRDCPPVSGKWWLPRESIFRPVLCR